MKIFKLVFSPIEVNTYILADESGDCAIIDCGCYDIEESSSLKDFLIDNHLRPVLLLNTHCHLDHVFGNRFMLENYDLRTFSSEFDEENRKNAAQHATLFGLKMDNPPEAAGFLNDNQVVTFGNIKLAALLVPGHTAGSLAFYCEQENVVFTGDALFSGSIGRTDLPGGDYDQLISAIRNKLFVLPPATIVYPGHGSETTIGREMMSNPFFN